MSYPWKDLSPKDPLIIRQTNFITNIDKKIITFLYQPIIGPQAYSLYMTLLSEVEEGSYRSEQRLHSDLLTLVSVGIPELYQARARLEGIGLLNTYLKDESDKTYIYEPCPPLSSKQFFEDDLMRVLLLEHIGENKLHSLQKKFSFPILDKAAYKNITKSFLDVYNVSAASYQKNGLIDQKGLAYMDVNNGKKPHLDNQTFDFNLLQQLLQKEFFSKNALTKEVQESINVFHHLFGIDEMEMSQYLLRATDLETGEVNTKELEQIILQLSVNKPYSNQRIQDKVMSTIEQTETETENRINELTKAGFSTSEIKLISQSERMTPIAFISNIKKQKNGTVTAAEKNLLTVLLAEHKLEPAVLNMLVYYSLVIQKHPTLIKAIAETIANDWTQSNVTKPEQAIEKTKQFVGQKKAAAEKREENRSARYYGKNVVRKVEKLPDWAKDNQGPITEEMLPEDVQKRFNERLKKFRNSGKAGDS